MSTFKEGLQDVIAATSSICFIDGDKGVLSYRGIDIHELARKSNFEEVCYLLWFGKLPRQAELDRLTDDLAKSRTVPPEVFAMMRSFPKDANPMDVMRTAVSALAFYDPDRQASSSDANLRKAYRLTGQIAGIVAAIERIRHGAGPRAARCNAEACRQFRLHADWQEAIGHCGKGDGRGPYPARRPRIECLHVRGTRDGGHTFRCAFSRHFSHWRP